MGIEPDAKLIRTKVLNEDSEIKIINLSEAYYFERVRYANKVPIGIERHYYPIEIGKQLIKYDLNRVAFYDLLEKELNIIALEAEHEIYSVNATKLDAKLLNIPVHSNLLHAKRKITDINGAFIELENALYRADMYSFKINLSRNGNKVRNMNIN